MQSLKFADANSEYEEAKFVILGVPFDATSSFRKGAALAPNRIREASYNFEVYLFEHEIEITEIPFCDLGNIVNLENVSDMQEIVFNEVKKFAKDKKFSIIIGGEHSLTPPIIKALSEFNKFSVISIDAHLDFREEYLNQKNSHACAMRRVADIINARNVFPIGIRSFTKEEKIDAKKLKLHYTTSFEIIENGIEKVVKQVLKKCKDKIYLTLDMDGFDFCYAPGVGTPEPYGLSPYEFKKIVELTAKKLIGFDIVEVCPPYDNGNTCALASRIIRDVIGNVWKEMH